MVGLLPLEQGILVRIQVSEPTENCGKRPVPLRGHENAETAKHQVYAWCFCLRDCCVIEFLEPWDSVITY
jgi:hypothetical protein